MRFFTLVLSIWLGGLMTASASAQPLPAGDFGFRFQFGMCWTETFDSFAGTYTHDADGDEKRAISTQFSLTDAQMRTIYQSIEQIRFFDYPSPFYGYVTGLPGVTVVHPSRAYRLTVRNGGVVHEVSWDDRTRPWSEEALRLQAFFTMLIGIIHDHPELKKLSRPRMGCI
jgi:hypothetical protein